MVREPLRVLGVYLQTVPPHWASSLQESTAPYPRSLPVPLSDYIGKCPSALEYLLPAKLLKLKVTSSFKLYAYIYMRSGRETVGAKLSAVSH